MSQGGWLELRGEGGEVRATWSLTSYSGVLGTPAATPAQLWEMESPTLKSSREDLGEGDPEEGQVLGPERPNTQAPWKQV